MRNLARQIDRFNIAFGRSVSWLLLGLVLVQFAVVVMRYVFGVGFIWAQESVIYLHAFLFLIAAAYVLAIDTHVRIDIFYRNLPIRRKALVDAAGALLFLLPTCAVIFQEAWPYVARSWQVLEGSRETSGIPAVFLLKSGILLFAGLTGLQGLSLLVRSVGTYREATAS
ncbi:TRAP transporter small permease subunit [Stappia sp. F7233]|uniref:TRAP transporter small permease protein n=1 Tax=Stappia albiluteola TaxID=2758565 RepID=A0A839AEY1_9HYPH|nr:TRAP transporter small permease subunit [Stappia albiluteola]MBA5777357.1 TRAP transporter small permease subunit [Stappia albiluteola]